MKLKIRVANPVSGKLTFIPFENAQRYVDRGRARWRNDRTIVFFSDSQSRFAGAASSMLQERIGYDRVGQMNIDQVTGFPMIGDPVKLFTLRNPK